MGFLKLEGRRIAPARWWCKVPALHPKPEPQPAGATPSPTGAATAPAQASAGSAAATAARSDSSASRDTHSTPSVLPAQDTKAAAAAASLSLAASAARLEQESAPLTPSQLLADVTLAQSDDMPFEDSGSAEACDTTTVVTVDTQATAAEVSFVPEYAGSGTYGGAASQGGVLHRQSSVNSARQPPHPTRQAPPLLDPRTLSAHAASGRFAPQQGLPGSLQHPWSSHLAAPATPGLVDPLCLPRPRQGLQQGHRC